MQKKLPVRKKIRLEGYDYSNSGAYFITICVEYGHKMLGEIVGCDIVGAIINRPQTDRPQTDRPQTDRPQTDRPQTDRPQIDRPQIDCPQTNRLQTQLSEYGIVVDKAINEISNHYPQITVDKYVVMPNHIHMVLFIHDENDGRYDENDERYDGNDGRYDGNDGRLIIAPTNISTIVQQLKRYVSKQIGFSLWQKSFHDHIIRDEGDYQRIWRYIDENPMKWAEDCFYK